MTFYPPPPHIFVKKRSGWQKNKIFVKKRSGWQKNRENEDLMPAAGRKRVEGASRFCRNRSQSVAIGRDWSPAETEDKAPKKSQSIAIGRNRSQSVALRRTGRQPKQKTRRRKSRVSAYRSQSVAIGRDWSCFGVSAYRSQSVAIGRDWSCFGVPVAIGRASAYRSRLVAIGRDWSC